jgi:hypothetical protein
VPRLAGVGVKQTVQVHDEIAHVRVIDGLLRLRLQATWAAA